MKHFTADQHFLHEKITNYMGRQLAGWERTFADVDEMNESMIMMWNSVVGKKDEVYQLGDFALGRWRYVKPIIERLNGKTIYFIPGGHDKRWIKGYIKEGGFENFPKVVILPQLFELKVNKQLIVLCHYPMFTWEQSHYGSWHLHGHSHGGLGKFNRYQKLIHTPPTTLEDGNSMDVGVDAWNFEPVSLAMVNEIFNRKDNG